MVTERPRSFKNKNCFQQIKSLCFRLLRWKFDLSYSTYANTQMSDQKYRLTGYSISAKVFEIQWGNFFEFSGLELSYILIIRDLTPQPIGIGHFKKNLRRDRIAGYTVIWSQTNESYYQ